MNVCLVSHAVSADRQGLDMLQGSKWFLSYASVLSFHPSIIYQSYLALHLAIFISETGHIQYRQNQPSSETEVGLCITHLYPALQSEDYLFIDI